MPKTRSERKPVEQALMRDPYRKAHEIAKEAGIIDTMGYDKAVDYVKKVKYVLKGKGLLPKRILPPEERRLRDITMLFRLRKGTGKHIRLILMLNCYYRLRSEDDDIHAGAIEDTYRKNAQLANPIPMGEAISLCEIALQRYMQSIDPEKNAAAQKKGYPSAGIHYTDERFIEKLEITDEELSLMVSIAPPPEEQS